MLRYFSLFLVLLLAGCQANLNEKKQKLPILGRKSIEGTDTTYHTIADFKFVNQDSATVTPETFKDKIYVADFFFTSCPTICPTMKAQMLRVYDTIQTHNDVLILSHTIDPEYDTVELLHNYAQKLGVSSDKWHFVTGNKDDIYKIGQTSYMVSAIEDPEEPGGFIHSGAFILVDKQRRIRGMYDGTKEEQVNKLISDIFKLENENN